MTESAPIPVALRILLVALLVGACGEGPTSFTEIIGLSFSSGELDLGFTGSGSISVRNVGDRELGPVVFSFGGSTNAAGDFVAGVTVTVDPQQIEVLAPGASALVTVALDVSPGVSPGFYRGSLQANSDFGARAVATVHFEVLDPALENVETVSFVDPPATLRQGELHRYRAVATTTQGETIADPPAIWTVEPEGAGVVTDGRFVGYGVGVARLIVRVSTVSDTVEVSVTERGIGSSFAHVGAAAAGARIGADLWVHGSHAYTGTWRGTNTAGVPNGDAMFVWDVSDPSTPTLTDSLLIDARSASDVKIRADGALGALTHSGSADGLNGVTFFTLVDPAHPQVLTRYTTGLEPGVSNLWLEGDYAYVAVSGAQGGLRILDISDPADPETVSVVQIAGSHLEDVYVRDGLAFLSYWDSGLVIFDVGHGMAGGSPEDPRFVSSVDTEGGQTHNAWYWPAGGYVFVGEEDFGTPGRMHVVDFSDPLAPVEVATFAVPGDPPHSIWMDEDRAILYAAWYTQGVRAIDVSGALMGELDLQGREIASALAGQGPRLWAPQLHDGLLFLADMNGSLQVVRPLF